MIMLVWTVGGKMNLVIQLVNVIHYQIYVDPLTNEYYLDIETSEWDEYDDGFVHQKEYIAYCPWCGRKLGE